MVTVADAALLRQAARGERDSRTLTIGYDRRSDTLTVHFYGRGIPAVSMPVGDGERDAFYVRVDPTTNRPVGIQIEGFLSSFATEHPELVTLLDTAELRGITREEVDQYRTRLAQDSADAIVSRFLEGVASE